jgi:hypothetical protein
LRATQGGEGGGGARTGLAAVVAHGAAGSGGLWAGSGALAAAWCGSLVGSGTRNAGARGAMAEASGEASSSPGTEGPLAPAQARALSGAAWPPGGSAGAATPRARAHQRPARARRQSTRPWSTCCRPSTPAAACEARPWAARAEWSAALRQRFAWICHLVVLRQQHRSVRSTLLYPTRHHPLFGTAKYAWRRSWKSCQRSRAAACSNGSRAFWWHLCAGSPGLLVRRDA